MMLKQNAYQNTMLKEIFEGRMKNLERDGKVYEMRVESLKEGGYIQGYMLWVLDVTQHHEMLMKIRDMANKDALTGVYNRNYFVTLLEEHVKAGGIGSLYMVDL